MGSLWGLREYAQNILDDKDLAKYGMVLEKMKKAVLITVLVFLAFLASSGNTTFADGWVAWNPQGVPVWTEPGDQIGTMRMVCDGSGGAIIVWEQHSGTDWDIYAQRVNNNGVLLWGGVAILCNEPGNQVEPVVAGDGYGGAIIAWQDYRNGDWDIYALRISSGTGRAYPGWPPGGVAVSASTTETEQCPDIVDVSMGEVIVVWQHETASNYSIRGQKMDGFGAPLWGGGVIISSGTAPKEFPKIINDGMGYVVVTWQDFRNTNSDIYAQKRKADDGTVAPGWAVDGNTVTVAALDQKIPQIVSDGSGGAIIAWTDYRNSNSDIYAQWISSTAVRLWENPVGDFNGIPVCNIVGEQSNPVIISHIYEGNVIGAIFSWEDRGADPNGDIYA